MLHTLPSELWPWLFIVHSLVSSRHVLQTGFIPNRAPQSDAAVKACSATCYDHADCANCTYLPALTSYTQAMLSDTVMETVKTTGPGCIYATANVFFQSLSVSQTLHIKV